MRIVSAVLAADSAADVDECDPCPPRISSAMQEGECWVQQS